MSRADSVYLPLMPWIETIHEDEWDGDLSVFKDEVTDPKWGRVDWIMRIHSIDPGSLHAHKVLYQQAMKGTPTLRKVEREMIALVVSQLNECQY
jgi:alkylhydroperoxidase family enzyme